MRVDCEQDPENCIRDCEASRASSECLLVEQELADCYSRAPVQDFVCVGRGFRSTPRPREGVCEVERDALVECQFPEVKACFDLCRELEAGLTSPDEDRVAGEGAVGSELSSAEISPSACPPRDIPCETLCWNLNDFAQYLRDTTDSSPEAGAGDEFESSLELFGGLIGCTLDRANACYAAEQEGSLSETDAVSDWERLLWECAAQVE